MNAPRPPQTAAPQMESNPLQRALDNYLVMELQCDAARHDAAETRAANARLGAEVEMLRERLAEVEVDRRKWQVTCSTLFGRLLAISDTINGAVKAAVRDGLEAAATNEPGEADAVAAAALQCAGADAAPAEAAKSEVAPAPLQAHPEPILPDIDFGGPRREFRQ